MVAHSKSLCVLFLLASLCQAQEIELTANQVGASRYELNIKAERSSALSYLSAIAEACHYRLEVESSELATQLSNTRFDVIISGDSLEEVINMIGLAAEVSAQADAGDQTIRVRTVPKDEEVAEASEFYRQQALHSLLVAFGDENDEDGQAQLMLRSAKLQLAGNQFQQAFDSFNSFLVKNKGHEAFPEASIGAAHAAFMSENHSEVQRVVQQLHDEFPMSRLIGRGEIIAARSRLKTGDIGGGVALLRSVIRQARNLELEQRDGIIAEFLLADALHARGEDEQAIRSLTETEVRYDRARDGDLINQVRLYMAICRHATGNVRDAIHDLELAAFEIPGDQLKARTMLFHAQLLLEAGDPFLALGSTRVAMRFEPQGRQLFETRRTMGRALRGLQLETEAASELLAAVLEAPALIPDPEQRRREVSLTLRDIGSIYLERGLVRDAISSFEAVISAAEHHGQKDESISEELVAECRYLIALSHFKAKDWKLAIDTLNSITSGISTESLAHDIRRLKGDCYFAAGMPEAAMRVWQEGESR